MNWQKNDRIFRVVQVGMKISSMEALVLSLSSCTWLSFLSFDLSVVKLKRKRSIWRNNLYLKGWTLYSGLKKSYLMLRLCSIREKILYSTDLKNWTNVRKTWRLKNQTWRMTWKPWMRKNAIWSWNWSLYQQEKK